MRQLHVTQSQPKMLSLEAFSRAQMRLAAGIRPDPLRVERSSRPPSRNRGSYSPTSKDQRKKGEGRGRSDSGMGLPPLYSTSGYGHVSHRCSLVYHLIDLCGKTNSKANRFPTY